MCVCVCVHVHTCGCVYMSILASSKEPTGPSGSPSVRLRFLGEVCEIYKSRNSKLRQWGRSGRHIRGEMQIESVGKDAWPSRSYCTLCACDSLPEPQTIWFFSWQPYEYHFGINGLINTFLWMQNTSSRLSPYPILRESSDDISFYVDTIAFMSIPSWTITWQ